MRFLPWVRCFLCVGQSAVERLSYVVTLSAAPTSLMTLAPQAALRVKGSLLLGGSRAVGSCIIAVGLAAGVRSRLSKEEMAALAALRRLSY